MIWTQLNEFEMFNEFEMMKRTLKTFIRIVLRTCKTVPRKPCINREANIKSSQFIYSVTVVERTTEFLAVVTPPSIYHDCPTRKTFWE